MANQHEILELRAPVGGQNKATGYQHKDPLYFEDGLNVRGIDVLENRGRIGSRPGTLKTYASQLGLPTPIESFSQEFYPSKDAYLDFELETTNRDTLGLRVGTFAVGVSKWRSILHFDVSDIPAGATITSATLYLSSSSGQGNANTGTAYRMTLASEGGHADTWVESQVTWNRASDAAAWSVVGGDYTTTGAIDFIITSSIGKNTQTIELNGLVQDAVDARSGQLHVLLRNAENVSNTHRYFKDIEYATGSDASDYWPRIVINWETGGPAGDDDSTEIRMMAVCATLTDAPITTFTEPFSDDPIDPTDWPVSGSWVVDGVTTSGKPTIALGNAQSLTASQLRSVALANQSISTVVAREVSITPLDMKASTEINLFMDMDNTTPLNTSSIRLRASMLSAGYWNLKLYVNDALRVNTYNTIINTNIGNRTIRLTIDASNTIRAYWESSTYPSITRAESGYVPAGGRVGFGLQNNSAGDGVLVSRFSFSYTPSSGVNPARMLMASANGYLYKETTAGTMILVTSTLTLRRDRLLSAANRLQKLFIADYELAVEGTAGTNTTTSFDDSAVADWTTVVDAVQGPLSYRLEIISGTGVTLGVYGIASVASGSLTLASSPGASGSAIKYRVIRGPKVYDATTNTLTMLGLGTIGVSQFPVGCRHFSMWADRLVACNDPERPYQWFMSAIGYPLLWDYGDSGDVGENGLTSDPIKLFLDPAAATSSNAIENRSAIGDDIICTIPVNNDYLIFACRNSIHIMRGNPRLSGRMDTISRDVGILDIGAWTRTPDGRILVLSLDGLYEVKLTGVESLSREVLPKELVGIDAERYEVTLGYDFPRRGVCICVVPRDLDIDSTLPSIHYFYDSRTGGFFPDEYIQDHDPTAVCVHQIAGIGENLLLRGCRDGYIRNFSNQAQTDDGEYINSYVFYGPIRLGGGEYSDGMLHEVVDVLDAQSGAVSLRAFVGHSAQAAKAATPRWDTVMQPGRNRNRWPRLRGGALYLMTDGTGIPWARESLTITRERLDKLRTTAV